MFEPNTAARRAHRDHSEYVPGCAYCLRRLEELREDDVQKVADYCLVHGQPGCKEPDCYQCGNHDLDDDGVCRNATCRAANVLSAYSLDPDAVPPHWIGTGFLFTDARWALRFPEGYYGVLHGFGDFASLLGQQVDLTGFTSLGASLFITIHRAVRMTWCDRRKEDDIEHIDASSAYPASSEKEKETQTSGNADQGQEADRTDPA